MENNLAFGGASDVVCLRYWEPPEHLRQYFGSAYHLVTRVPHFRDMTRADVPQLRFILAGGGDYIFYNRETVPTPEVAMIGPTNGVTHFALNGEASVIGVSVLPKGWLALGCDDADSWVGSLYDAEQRHGIHFRTMLKRLRATTNMDDGVQQIWAFLQSQLQPILVGGTEVIDKVDAWLGQSDAPKIEDIVASTGLSPRQLARYTNRFYGAPPKLLARKYRALKCASQIVLDKKSWPELCEDGRFYDQSHFIREIKQFLGLTPNQLLNDPTIIARLTVQRRVLSGLVRDNLVA